MAFGRETSSKVGKECCVMVNTFNAELTIKRIPHPEPPPPSTNKDYSAWLAEKHYSIKGLVWCLGEAHCINLGAPKKERTIRPVTPGGSTEMNLHETCSVVLDCKGGSFPGNRRDRRGSTGTSVKPTVSQTTDREGKHTMSMFSCSWDVCTKNNCDGRPKDKEKCPATAGREGVPDQYGEAQEVEELPCCCRDLVTINIDTTFSFNGLKRPSRDRQRDELQNYGEREGNGCSEAFYDALGKSVFSTKGKNAIPGKLQCNCVRKESNRKLEMPEQPPGPEGGAHPSSTSGNQGSNQPIGLINELRVPDCNISNASLI
jgi:hypothetical protein